MKTRSVILILLALSMVLLSSCDPCKRLARRCPPHIEIRDSIIERTIIQLKDTTIFVKLPADTITDSIPIPCPDIPPGIVHPAVWPNKLTVTGYLATAHSYIRNSRLFLELHEKDTLLEIKLKDAIREKNHYRELYHSKTEVQPPPPVSWWKTTFFGIGIITTVLAIIFLVLKALKLR